MLDIIKEKLKDFHMAPVGDTFLDSYPDANEKKYYRFFYWMTSKFKPEVVVELGSWQGVSAAHFAAGCSKTTVITVDHHSDPGDEINQKNTENACELFPNMKYCRGWTCNELYEEEKDAHKYEAENAFPKVLKELNGRKIDILFIDSWHRYDQALKDWNAYKPYLKDGALVICDDILKGTKGSGIEDMDKFWDDLKGNKFLDNTLHVGYPMGFYEYRED